MSRKVGQIIARGEHRWLVRVYLGRDRETRKRTYHNRTIYGSLRHAQAYLTKRLHERDLRVFSVEEAKIFLKFALPTMYGCDVGANGRRLS